MVQLDTYEPLRIESDYHSASYHSKNLDTWMFTNSTEVTLSYEFNRLGRLRTKINVRWFLQRLARFRDKTAV